MLLGQDILYNGLEGFHLNYKERHISYDINCANNVYRQSMPIYVNSREQPNPVLYVKMNET